MSMIEDYQGNMIEEDKAVLLAGGGGRWAHVDDPNIIELEGHDGEETHCLDDEVRYDERRGVNAHESTVRYVSFNDAYTSDPQYYYLNCGTEYIPSCGDHVIVGYDTAYDPADVGSCNHCGDTHPCDELEDDYCSSCAEDMVCGRSEYLQSYHDHGLGDSVQVYSLADPESPRHRGLYSVGFEVEKNRNGYGEGEYMGCNDLFAYWESDGSCGIEGITHAYTLGSSRLFSNHVSAASSLLNLGADDRCGGHFSLKGPKVSLATVRQYAGLLYALYRHRLKNDYCRHNPRLLEGTCERYSTVRVRSVEFCEFRVPRGVKNATQLRNRFEFIQLLSDAIYEEKTFRQYLRSNTALMRRVYPDVEKRRVIWDLARHFQHWILEDEAHESIKQWIYV